jgi:hypothetical protein
MQRGGAALDANAYRVTPRKEHRIDSLKTFASVRRVLL